MHLGRFHAAIYDLKEYFERSDLPGRLDRAAAILDQYAQSRSAAHLDAFRDTYQELLDASEIDDPNLEQPYAQYVVRQLSLSESLGSKLRVRLEEIVNDRGFDHAGIAKDFRSAAEDVRAKVADITAIETGFGSLGVEFERVEEEHAEVGVLLPRELVGESLTELTAEFNKLSKLFQAVNELTGADHYVPKVRTISSSWWQIFLDVDPNQILVWVLAVERIVGLFKSNLEIKNLQKQLSDNKMPLEIINLVEAEIQRRVSVAIDSLASEIRTTYGRANDEGRLNEIEIQLKQGLRHLAVRINSGAQVEINVGVPSDPEDEDNAGTEDEEVVRCISEQREKIAKLRALRERGQAASVETLRIDERAHLLLDYFAGKDEGSDV